MLSGLEWPDVPENKPEGRGPQSRKCDRCGKFTKNLTTVWAHRPNPEPDYEIGDCCKETK